MKSLQTAATGMMAQQLNVEVISNNIANMRTTGFKRVLIRLGMPQVVRAMTGGNASPLVRGQQLLAHQLVGQHRLATGLEDTVRFPKDL